MRVSANELMTSLKRAFEGLGFPQGAYEDAAAMVLWMETRGFDGLDTLKAGLDRLRWPTKTPTLLDEDEHHASIEGHGGNCLAIGAAAFDLAVAKARLAGYAEVELRNCGDRRFIVERLLGAAKRGLHCTALWQTEVEPPRYRRVSVAAQASSVLYGLQPGRAERDAGLSSIFLICAADADDLNQKVALLCEPDRDLLSEITSEELAQRHDAALEQGIQLEDSLWNSLDALTANILVESTAASRAGAGE